MAQELRQAGWTKARALLGGWNAWLDANLPVEPLYGSAAPASAR